MENRKLSGRYFLLAAVTAFIVCSTARGLIGRHPHQLVFTEVIVYWAGLLVLLSLQPVRQFVKCMGHAHRWVFVILFGLMLFGQTADKTAHVFPFLGWFMYTRPAHQTSEPLVGYRFYGVDQNGSKIPIAPAHPFSFRRAVIFPWRLRELASLAVAPGDDTAGSSAKQRLDDTLIALGKLHNKKHPDAKIGSVEVLEYKVARVRVQNRSGDAMSVVWRVDLGPKS